MSVSTYLSIIRLNVNELNAPIKKHDEVEFILVCKSTNMIFHINKRKNKNHMIISIDTEKNI